MFTDESQWEKAPTPRPAEPRLVTWPSLSTEDLIAYRDQITAELRTRTALSLKDLSVEEELLLQFHTVRVLQQQVIEDETIPPNQRAQVANSVNHVLSRVIDLQSEVYESERFKRIETALIRALDTLPEETAAKFLADYERVVSSLER